MVDYLQATDNGFSEGTKAYHRKLNAVLNLPPEQKLDGIKSIWPETHCHLSPLPDCFLCHGFGMRASGSRSDVLKSETDNRVVGSFQDYSPCLCMLYGTRAPSMEAAISVASERVVTESQHGLEAVIN